MLLSLMKFLKIRINLNCILILPLHPYLSSGNVRSGQPIITSKSPSLAKAPNSILYFLVLGGNRSQRRLSWMRLLLCECCNYYISENWDRVRHALFNCSVMSDSLWHHSLQHARLPCPSPSPGACLNSCPLSGDTIKPSHPLSAPSPPDFYLPQLQGLFQWISSSH